MSNGKHRLGHPLRISDISDIHARLIGAGLIGGAFPRVMNPISGRVCVSDLSLDVWNPLPHSTCHAMAARPVSLTNGQFSANG
jgi:hypothetical protein